jgi:hypothetical protein
MSKSTLWIIENLTKEESYLELDACARKLGYVVLSLRGDFVKKDFIEQVGQKVRPVIVCAGIGMNSVITGPYQNGRTDLIVQCTITYVLSITLS